MLDRRPDEVWGLPAESRRGEGSPALRVNVPNTCRSLAAELTDSAVCAGQRATGTGLAAPLKRVPVSVRVRPGAPRFDVENTPLTSRYTRHDHDEVVRRALVLTGVHRVPALNRR